MRLQNYYQCLNCGIEFALPLSSPKNGKYCKQECFFEHKKKIGTYAASKLEPILIRSDAVKQVVVEEIPVPDIQVPQNDDASIQFDDLSLNDIKILLVELNQTNKRLKGQIDAYKELVGNVISTSSEIDLTYDKPLPVEGIEPEETPVEEEEVPVENPCAFCGKETGDPQKVFCGDACAIDKIPPGAALRMNDGRMLNKPVKPYTSRS